MIKLWLVFKPNCKKFIIDVILTLLSLTVTTGLWATSKVTWTANKGFPFPFAHVTEYVQGTRCMINRICIVTNIQEFHIYSFLLDLLAWYLITCVLTLGFTKMKENGSCYALCCTTGQFSTQAPQPVHRSMLMLRARFLIFTLKLPGSPSTLSRSA